MCYFLPHVACTVSSFPPSKQSTLNCSLSLLVWGTRIYTLRIPDNSGRSPCWVGAPEKHTPHWSNMPYFLNLYKAWLDRTGCFGEAPMNLTFLEMCRHQRPYRNIDVQKVFFAIVNWPNSGLYGASVCIMYYFDQSATNQLDNVFLIVGCGFL